MIRDPVEVVNGIISTSKLVKKTHDCWAEGRFLGVVPLLG